MKRLYYTVGGIAVLAIVGTVWWVRGSHIGMLDTTYEAVLLDNGQVYYGKIDRLDSDFSVLTDVYYIERQVDAQTKEVKNILIRRGNEWHAPNRAIINSRHIVMIEPVTPGSKVADLIAALKSKNE